MRRATPADTIRAALDGDPEAEREFRRTSFPAMRDWQATLRWLLASDPEAVRAELVELLSTIQDELLGPSEPNLGELQRIEAAAVAEAARTTDPERLITELASGVTYVPEVGQTEVVLVPDSIDPAGGRRARPPRSDADRPSRDPRPGLDRCAARSARGAGQGHRRRDPAPGPPAAA